MKKNLWLWALYDFANCFVLMGFLFYFSQWLVIDQGRPAWWYNAALIISSAFFIITAPVVSKKVDATGAKLGGLRFWTFFTFAGYFAVSIITVFSDNMGLVATVFYTFASYAYLVCFLYFTPMLNDLSDTSDRSWKSGIGQGANSLGQVAGVLVTLPFVNGLTLFGDPGRAQALFPATIMFGLLALPMLIFYKENFVLSKNSNAAAKPSIVSLFKEVFAYKALALILVAYFLASDAMLTFANNFPLYLEVVYKSSDTMKSILTAGILVLAAAGALVFGKIADKKGGLRIFKIILITWCFILLTASLITEFKIMVPIFLFAGFMFGPVWGLSRSLVGQYAPAHLVASSYSYYVVAERFATFVGPAIWSVVLLSVGETARGYQTAMFALMLVVITSVFVLNKVRQAA